ncbi:hypothetical protein PAHAL_3G151200 [Panicum hallii]|uniref:Peptidase A1 domain-containing protein n=1 Tax=Panicum hallii TaxID=206008 RepID=A0A2S3H8W3_9POAL|nr:hypothetical protein PAHAL_3G151200 [Panicum hallii]
MMPGRWVASVLLLALHGLLSLQPAARAEMQGDDGSIEDGSSIHFPVSPPVVPDAAEERRAHFRALEAKDLFRYERLLAMSSPRNGSRRQARQTSKVPDVLSDTSEFAELPMRSALNIAHVGMYLVSVRFGTPALPFNLVLDTANDLTWISCRLRRRKGKHYGRSSAAQTMSVGADGVPVKKATTHFFRPSKSSSWRRIRCSQPECGVLPYTTCEKEFTQAASCSYHQKVLDGTVTIGIYGMEKATVALSDGKMAKLPGLVLGCSVMEAGLTVDAHDGVLSLGNGEVSFGVIASSRFASRFSFCLLSANSERTASSYLTFGPNPAVMGPGTMVTDISYNNYIHVAFGFRVTGISVGGQPLDIPPEVWDDKLRHGGVVLDTGTSVTALVPAAYDAVTAALDSYLGHLPRITDMPGFEFCYNWTFTGDGVDPAHNVTIPSFDVELQGGAVLQADAKSVVMPEVQPGVACLAFRKLLEGPNIIGNVLMQEHIWEFEHRTGVMRFRKDKCTNHHLKGNSTTANIHQAYAPGPSASSDF